MFVILILVTMAYPEIDWPVLLGLLETVVEALVLPLFKEEKTMGKNMFRSGLIIEAGLGALRG